MGHVFNPRMVERLEDPARLEFQNPEKLLSLMKPLDGKGFLDFGVGTGFSLFPSMTVMETRALSLALISSRKCSRF